MLQKRTKLKNFEVVYWNVDPYDARFDGIISVTFDAVDEQEALAQFERDFGTEHKVQSVFELE